MAYPTASRPQAWAAASVLLLVRVLLGLDADLPHGRLGVKPILPRDAVPLGLRGLRLAGGRLSLEVDADGTVSSTECPDGIVLVDDLVRVTYLANRIP